MLHAVEFIENKYIEVIFNFKGLYFVKVFIFECQCRDLNAKISKWPLLKGINRFLSKGMSNIYLKIPTEKK